MKKSCLKFANDEDENQSMHPVRTVGSVHATNKNIENVVVVVVVKVSSLYRLSNSWS